MPKLGGSRYADLTEPQGVTPVYWQITNKSSSPREGGWEILKLNCYKLCTLVQAARIMPSDSVLRLKKQDSVSKFDQQEQLYYKLNRRNVASLLAMNGADKYMSQSRRS